MNIQIFGRKKCFDTKKAERYFKERGIKFQYVDINSKGLSRGELDSVLRSVGSVEALIDCKNSSQDAVLLKYLSSEEEKKEKLLENPLLFKTPVVRNGKNATIGYCPEIWAQWN
ncbi:ArsC/Spx/MgsR family protein [Ruminococcus sp. Marseille-P6503]|uniref:arsenate reductase family protein n=1 Tax=Ruminococcus sp. Marseille-P6503 TaxID=2364796 RepID=UPI000F53E17B|nr:ArsC/Spx/MgsR family protein [Ruminococcus sp. Marseille-P6503]